MCYMVPLLWYQSGSKTTVRSLRFYTKPLPFQVLYCLKYIAKGNILPQWRPSPHLSTLVPFNMLYWKATFLVIVTFSQWLEPVTRACYSHPTSFGRGKGIASPLSQHGFPSTLLPKPQGYGWLTFISDTLDKAQHVWETQAENPCSVVSYVHPVSLRAQ